MLFFRYKKDEGGFTLIELLIVIAIIAILGSAVVLVLNPVEIIKQGRDSQRITDMDSLAKGVGLAKFNNQGSSLGSANVVYISIPDSSATCSNIAGLPILTGGYTYQCATSANYRNINGTGWIPLDFTSNGTSLPNLPVDPLNNSTAFYSYIADPNTNTYALAANFESQKSIDLTGAKDGGPDTGKYEVGTQLSLTNVLPASTLAISGVPNAPTGLVGQALGATSVKLTWVAPTSGNVTGYKIYRGLAANPTTLLTTLGNVLTYTDSAATTNTAYYYRVVPTSGSGDGASSSDLNYGAFSYTFSYVGAIQTWTVPLTTTYIIDAYGAQGGSGTTYTGGLGARIKGSLSLTSGSSIKILVGGQGGSNASYKAGGGGGGTFVTTNTNSPLVVAGGGGGGGGNSSPANGQPGLVGTAGGAGSTGVYAGGTAGGGGSANIGTAGGGGLTGNGGTTTCTYIASVGLSFVNGGAGGAGGSCAAGGGVGGFGGGSGGEWCCQGATGAGGGYSGGGGTDSAGVAGGGGSYNSGTNQTNTSGARSGNGVVYITNY